MNFRYSAKRFRRSACTLRACVFWMLPSSASHRNNTAARSNLRWLQRSFRVYATVGRLCWPERRPNHVLVAITVVWRHGFQALYLPLSLSPSLFSLWYCVSLSVSPRASASEFSRLVLVLEGAEEELHLRRTRGPARWVVSAYCCIGSGSPVTVHGLQVPSRR